MAQLSLIYLHGIVPVMNISTSCQLIFPVGGRNFTPPRPDNPSPISYFPYFNRQYLAVAPSLNGGNVLAHFVKMIQQWFAAFGRLLIDLFSRRR